MNESTPGLIKPIDNLGPANREKITQEERALNDLLEKLEQLKVDFENNNVIVSGIKEPKDGPQIMTINATKNSLEINSEIIETLKKIIIEIEKNLGINKKDLADNDNSHESRNLLNSYISELEGHYDKRNALEKSLSSLKSSK